MSRALAVVNAETGRTVVGPATGRTVELVADAPFPVRAGDVVVRIRPAFRAGMPYDLATYPAAWLREVSS